MGTYCNYVDALAYALALSGERRKTTRLTSDPTSWHTAIYKLAEKYKDGLPEVFSDILFETRTTLAPYSPQVDHLIHVMAQGRLMSSPNPSYQAYEMGPAQRSKLIKLNKPRFEKHRDLMQRLGDELTAKLRYRVG